MYLLIVKFLIRHIIRIAHRCRICIYCIGIYPISRSRCSSGSSGFHRPVCQFIIIGMGFGVGRSIATKRIYHFRFRRFYHFRAGNRFHYATRFFPQAGRFIVQIFIFGNCCFFFHAGAKYFYLAAQRIFTALYICSG